MRFASRSDFSKKLLDKNAGIHFFVAASSLESTILLLIDDNKNNEFFLK